MTSAQRARVLLLHRISSLTPQAAFVVLTIGSLL